MHKSNVLMTTATILAITVFATTRLPVNLFDFNNSTILSNQMTLPIKTSTEQTNTRLKTFKKQARSDPDVTIINIQIANGSKKTISFAPQTNTTDLTILIHNKKTTNRIRKRLQ